MVKGGMREMNGKLLGSIIGIIVLIAVVAGAYFSYSNGPEVTAQGSSVIEATPDEVSVYVLIEGRGDTAEEAKNNHNAISDEVILQLVKLGFDRKDIQSAYYNIYPDYDYSSGNPKLKGYVASEQLVVKTQDFSKVTSIVDAAIDSDALIQSINFELSQEKQNEYKIMALEAAGQDAQKKAEAIAAGVDKKLGKLVSVQSQDFYYPGPIAFYAKSDAMGGVAEASEARSAALNIYPRQLEVTATINTVYKLR